jgi:IMP cyclohydrolase
MSKGFESLSAMEYPGRVIIIGKDRNRENIVVIYAITGRSPSSQARKLEIERGVVWTKPTDEAKLKSGNIDLLIYPAISIHRGIAVSNGKQTQDILEHLSQSQNPAEVLRSSLQHWNYEPDAPNFTPRISGCITPQKKAAFSIIKRTSDGASVRNFFDIPLAPGKGKMIATYTGEDKDPLPSFEGEPLDVELEPTSADEITKMIFQAIAPKEQEKDYRVAVACIFSRNLAENEFKAHIINRHERMSV